MKATDIKEIEAMTGAKVVAATKETSSFNSDFVLLDDSGTIRQAFTVRDINGKMCVDVFAAEYDTIAAALAYLNMTDEELAQNIEYINPENTPSTMNANEINTAICPLDFPTAIDAYNYALAHQHDTTPLAVAIESNNHNAPLLRSLVLNGVKVFGVWCDAMDDTATSLLYTTEAGAREAMAQIEANDREAGIYEPDYYAVVDMSKYFA